ncbi:23947_t:CDS:1, partial [Gigaspora rosea]
PVKRDLGQKVKTTGVSFEDSYHLKALKVQGIYKEYKKEIKEFDKKLVEAAKEDGTDEKTLNWLRKWNKDYGKQLHNLHTTAEQLIGKINKLKNKLGE